MEQKSREALLLEQYQPLLIQQVASDYSALPYSPNSDRIGALWLREDPEGYEYAVEVETSSPVFYSFARQMLIRGRGYQQLIYAFFYPERPMPVESDDNFLEWYNRFIWSGLIDGKVIRITLDPAGGGPLFVEVLRNCGCAWELYVNHRVDVAARQEAEEAGQVYPGLVKPDAPNDVQYVWIMPEDHATDASRVVVAAEEGWGVSPHETLGAFTSYGQWLNSTLQVNEGVLYMPREESAAGYRSGSLEIKTYELRPYDQLLYLSPEGSGRKVGIFDAYRYVWNAYSPLTELMRAVGAKKFPGTPRDPDHLEVVHETMDFWEQSLYERFIVLPNSLFGSEGK
jgi:hypothetical protein